jgi:hypothetical protein
VPLLARYSKPLLVTAALVGAAAAGFALIPAPAPASEAHVASDNAASDGEPELALMMSHLQRYSHKAFLAADARNAPLADFYLHETEEVIEQIVREVPGYEGYPVGSMMAALMERPLEELEQTVREGRWSEVRPRVEAVVASCNTCHVSTDHAYLVMTPGLEAADTYNQDFSPLD